MPDLRAAKNGGAVGLAGWAFVKEAFYDPTKVWSLLPQDNSTELVSLMHELTTNGAQLRLLVNQFMQLSEADLDALRADVGVALVMVYMLLQGVSALRKLHLDPAGWVAAGFGAAIVELIPDSTMFEAIRHFTEPSKSAVDAINANGPGTARWSPYPATLADNPLADNPLQIADVPISALTRVGVYHEKIAAMQAAGQPPIAYLGGIDLNSDRLDDPDHRAYAPFHDVQVRLTGPAVADVVASFAERAAVDGTSSPLVLPSDPLPDTGHHIVQLGRTRFAPGTGPGAGPAFPSAPFGDDSTHQALLAAINAAQDYIYIEEQYFTPDNEYVDALVDAGTRTNPGGAPQVQALVITLPDQTTQPYGAERRGEIIAKLATTWGDRLRVGAPIRRYLNPTPQLFGGLGRMVLRAAITTLGNTEVVVGPAERLPAVPFWAFAESELVYVDGVVHGGPGTGLIGEQDPDAPDSPTQTWQWVTIQRAPIGQDPRWGAKPDKHDKNRRIRDGDRDLAPGLSPDPEWRPPRPRRRASRRRGPSRPGARATAVPPAVLRAAFEGDPPVALSARRGDGARARRARPGPLARRRARAGRPCCPRSASALDRRFSRTESLDLGRSAADPVATPVGVDSINDLRYEWRATWDLGRIVFNPDEVGASTHALRMAEVRREIETVVIRLYFERRRLKAEALASDASEGTPDVRVELHIQELEAELDALTGGAFSRWRSSRAGEPPASP